MQIEHEGYGCSSTDTLVTALEQIIVLLQSTGITLQSQHAKSAGLLFLSRCPQATALNLVDVSVYRVGCCIPISSAKRC